MENQDTDDTSLETLEEIDTTKNPLLTTDVDQSQVTRVPQKKSIGGLLDRAARAVNVYLLLFILLLVVAGIVAFVLLQSSNDGTNDIETQVLTQDAIDSLNSNETTVGDPKQLLSIESNAVFSGKVLVSNGLEVAGQIKVSGDSDVPGITVSGRSALDDVELNTLFVANDATLQGVLTIQGGLSVNGQTTFGAPISAPSITIEALQLTGDLQLSRHIDAGGPTPAVSSGSGVGAGGTVTVSGTDTAGTVTINVGSGAVAGTLASVSFASVFGSSPHVVITPVATLGSAVISGTQQFYLSSRTSSGFTIATTGALATGSISFDYIVID